MSCKMLILVVLLAFSLGCALAGTRQAKEEKGAEITAIASMKVELETKRDSLVTRRLDAIAAGRPLEAAAIAKAIVELDELVGEKKSDLKVARSQFNEISIEERRQRRESAAGWLKIAMGVATAAVGGGGIGAGTRAALALAGGGVGPCQKRKARRPGTRSAKASVR